MKEFKTFTIQYRYEILVLLLALAVFLPGLFWGVPQGKLGGSSGTWAPDESAPIEGFIEVYAVLFAENPTYNPQYPLFHYLVKTLFIAPYLIFLLSTGKLSQPDSTYPYGLSNPEPALEMFTILSRLPSLLMTLGIVFIAMKLGEKLRGKSAAILAGLASLTISPLYYYSTTANMDVPALFWTVWGMLVFVHILKNGPSLVSISTLATLSALATATKDQSYAPFFAMFVAVFLMYRPGSKNISWKQWSKNIILLIVTGACVYIPASGLLFSLVRYRQHVDFVLNGSAYSQYNPYGYFSASGWEGVTQLFGSLSRGLMNSLQLPGVVLAIVAVVWAIGWRRNYLVLLIPALGILAGVIAPTGIVRIRFLLLVGFCLVLLVALFLDHLLKSGRNTKLAGVVALGMFFSSGLYHWFHYNQQLRLDSRYALSHWLHENIQSNKQLLYFGPARKLPRLPGTINPVNLDLNFLHLLQSKDSALVVNKFKNLLKQNGDPDLILFMPLQEYETNHEWVVHPYIYRAIISGELGYDLAKQFGKVYTPPEKRNSPISFVNPLAAVYHRGGFADTDLPDDQIRQIF